MRTLSEGALDPRILAEQPGLSPDSSKEGEGANYLRKLRGNVTEGAQAAASATGNSEFQAGKPAIDWKEWRQSPRLRCSGSAEFRTEGSDVRMWGTITDVSLHGCYVEMTTTFPVDTKVDLVLKSCGIRIEALGIVRASYPFLGMGICFTYLEPQQQAHLKELLAALGGRRIATNETAAGESALKETLRAVDARALVNEMMEFFRKNQQLSRDEFHKIAKRVHRP
jgi:hypothetical protein